MLNYESPKVDELFDAYIQHFTPKISKFSFEKWNHIDYRKFKQLDSNALYCIFPGLFDPHMLVLLAYVLALTNRFQEPLIREIFRVDFLAKLDAQLESMYTT